MAPRNNIYDQSLPNAPQIYSERQELIKTPSLKGGLLSQNSAPNLNININSNAKLQSNININIINHNI